MFERLYKMRRSVVMAVVCVSFVFGQFSTAAAADEIDEQIAQTMQALDALTAKKNRQAMDQFNHRLESLEATLSEQSPTYDAEGAIDALAAQINELRGQMADILSRLESLAERPAAAVALDNPEPQPLYTSTRSYLVHPHPIDAETSGADVSYTQDAVNSQGNSTMVFRYSPNQLYKIYCRPGYLTDIALKAGETVSFVGGGDTSGWAVNSSTVAGTPHIYLKPVVDGTPSTNLIITTSERSYQLILECSDWYNPMIRWTYDVEDHAMNLLEQAKEERTTTGSVNVSSIEDLDFEFSVSGSGSDMPIMVFTDGEKTYLKFKKQQKKQVPIFIRPRGKKELSLVNYQIKDNYYIIDAVFDFAQIKGNGKHVIEIKHK